jgi:HK97 family phage prohead protease
MDADAFFEALASVPNFRTASFNDLEMVPRGKGYRFTGHAAVFGEAAYIDTIPGVGKLTEEVLPGAFDEVLRQDANIPLTLEHDPKTVYATTRSGRLKLGVDGKGLAVDANLPDTSAVRDLKANVDADIIRGMSYGFVLGPLRNQRVEVRSGGRHRILQGFKKLLDVCATWDPTYPSAEAQFRSMTMQWADSAESVQQLLMGAYPQLQEQGTDEGTGEGEPPADDPPPDGEGQGDGESEASGVVELRSIAARRRALSLYLIEHGDVTT